MLREAVRMLSRLEEGVDRSWMSQRGATPDQVWEQIEVMRGRAERGECVFTGRQITPEEIDEHRAEYPTDGSVQHRRAVVGEQRRLVDLRGAVERKKRTAEERAQEREEREARRRESERARRLKRELVERVERAQTTLW